MVLKKTLSQLRFLGLGDSEPDWVSSRTVGTDFLTRGFLRLVFSLAIFQN